jgi:hypothetical protein
MKNPIKNIITISKILFLILILICIGCTGSNQISNEEKFKDIIVQLSYPSEGIPPLNIYLKEKNSGKVYLYENFDGNQFIKIKNLPWGEYVAFAYTKDFILGKVKARGSYTYAVDCGLSVDCKNFSLKKCLINKDFNDTIKILDWYNENNIPSEPTKIFEILSEKKKEKMSNSDENIMTFIPEDINSEYIKVTLEISPNNRVNLTQFFRNGDEFSIKGVIENGMINLDEPDREDIIEIYSNKLSIENQWVGKNIFKLKGLNTQQNESINGETLYKYDNIGEIRNLVIAGGKRNFLKRLGQPNEEYSAYNFLDKYFHNKFNINSIYWGSAILHGEVYVYNNLTNKPIIIVYNSRKDIVKEVLFIEDVSSINDVAIR